MCPFHCNVTYCEFLLVCFLVGIAFTIKYAACKWLWGSIFMNTKEIPSWYNLSFWSFQMCHFTQSKAVEINSVEGFQSRPAVVLSRWGNVICFLCTACPFDRPDAQTWSQRSLLSQGATRRRQSQWQGVTGKAGSRNDTSAVSRQRKDDWRRPECFPRPPRVFMLCFKMPSDVASAGSGCRLFAGRGGNSLKLVYCLCTNLH